MGEAKRRKQSDPNYGKPWWQQEGKPFKLQIEPNYTHLVELFLSEGAAGLTPAIFDWLQQTGQIYSDEPSFALLHKVNQISMTVYSIAPKHVQSLSSYNPKLAAFTLKLALQPEDFGNYQSVSKNRELATEAMRLINTGFFDSAITFLLNKDGDAPTTLRKHGVVLYMGTNISLEIIDTACALATWKPFEISLYAGEQRNSLSRLIEKTFSPLTETIQQFRVKNKGADKFPCLSLLCLIENKANGSICEFRKHYTAQEGNQLIIPGFSSKTRDAVLASSCVLDVLGSPRNIPTIRGFNSKTRSL